MPLARVRAILTMAARARDDDLLSSTLISRPGALWTRLIGLTRPGLDLEWSTADEAPVVARAGSGLEH